MQASARPSFARTSTTRSTTRPCSSNWPSAAPRVSGSSQFDFDGRAADEFLARVTGDAEERLVDLDEPAGLDVGDRHQGRGVAEGERELLLALAEGFLGTLPIRHVVVDAEHPEHAAVFAVQRDLRRIDPEARAVGLLQSFEDVLLGPILLDHLLVVRAIGLGLVARPRQVEVGLADDLLRRLQPGGPREHGVAAEIVPRAVLPEHRLRDRVEDQMQFRLAAAARGLGSPQRDLRRGAQRLLGHDPSEPDEELHHARDTLTAEPGHPPDGVEVGLTVEATLVRAGGKGRQVDVLVVVEELPSVDVAEVHAPDDQRGHHFPEPVLAAVGDVLPGLHVAGEVQVAFGAVAGRQRMHAVEPDAGVLPADVHQDASLQVHDRHDGVRQPAELFEERCEPRQVEQVLEVDVAADAQRLHSARTGIADRPGDGRPLRTDSTLLSAVFG